MEPFERWCQHTATLLVGGTGAAYALVRYGIDSTDPFAVVNHPAQPHLQHLHVLVAPLLVFVVGWSWREHVAPRLGWSGRAGFASGITLVASFVPMVVSGALIQIAVEPSWRRAWVAVHLVASALWLAGSAAHQLARWRSARRRPGGRGAAGLEAAGLGQAGPGP